MLLYLCMFLTFSSSPCRIYFATQLGIYSASDRGGANNNGIDMYNDSSTISSSVSLHIPLWTTFSFCYCYPILRLLFIIHFWDFSFFYVFTIAFEEKTQIIAGMLSVTLVGFNLIKPGTVLLPPSLSVTVRGKPCTSLRVIDSPSFINGLSPPNYLTALTCISYQPGAVDNSVTSSDVTISVSGGMGGSTTGSPTDLQTLKSYDSLSAIRAGAGGRATLVSVTLQVFPFQPQALFFHTNLDPNSVNSNYLYWTNADTTTGIGSIFRCQTDGQRSHNHMNVSIYWLIYCIFLSIPLLFINYLFQCVLTRIYRYICFNIDVTLMDGGIIIICIYSCIHWYVWLIALFMIIYFNVFICIFRRWVPSDIALTVRGLSLI